MDKEFDLIYLPGGQPRTDNLANDPNIEKLLQKNAKPEEIYRGYLCHTHRITKIGCSK
jgi:hypothetical protein